MQEANICGRTGDAKRHGAFQRLLRCVETPLLDTPVGFAEPESEHRTLGCSERGR